MINEAYAADISKKVRAQQNQAMRDGEFVGARPPYGYRKDPDNCHRLLVNEDTAPVVRGIFQWAADGVIEALCHETLPVWAVQWHPERLEEPQGLALMRAFVRLRDSEKNPAENGRIS